jgi:heme-degrading monooxygenase HmoA
MIAVANRLYVKSEYAAVFREQVGFVDKMEGFVRIRSLTFADRLCQL